ncbi:hypothetical protein BDW67DRAFT_188091 [Aspergillus spinulosporus]
MASAEPPRPARKVQKAYLRELERRHSPALHSRSRHVLQTEDHPPAQDRPRSRFSRNPLTETEYSFAKSPDGRFWYMGPSSSWSFCRRVLALLGEQVPEANNPPDPWNIDGTAFMLKWRPLPADETPDLSDLPPMDYGLYLLHTVRFHFGPLFYIIDEAAFIQDLHHFYSSPEDQVGPMRIWFAQYLLIIAFGKAFLAPDRQPNAPPDGHQYASRAMALMPDMSGLHSDQLQCIQALALAALYFQSVDMRVAAFQHIGFALRVCIIEGIHRHVPEHLEGEVLTRRCRTLFWMVYMLERDFSALIGAPSSIRDEDITVKLFAEGSVEEKTLTLHVQLARLSARILTTVYGVGANFDGTLINDTQSIFRNLAELSQDLNDFLKTHFHGSLSRASRAATRLILAYHHCVVLTTRPLVMCALHAHLEHAQNEPQAPNYPSTTPNPLAIPLSPVVSSLLHCCVESAQTVLQTLRTLADSDRIEAFLPFQIEDAFASTFLLHIICVIAPTLAPEETWLENADFVMDVLVRKGNLAAPLRKVELECLRRVVRPLTLANAKADSSVVRGENGSEGGNTAVAGTVDENGRTTGVVPVPDQELDWDIFTVDATVGLEPQELFDLADQLDIQGVMNLQYVAGLPP